MALRLVERTPAPAVLRVEIVLCRPLRWPVSVNHMRRPRSHRLTDEAQRWYGLVRGEVAEAWSRLPRLQQREILYSADRLQLTLRWRLDREARADMDNLLKVTQDAALKGALGVDDDRVDCASRLVAREPPYRLTLTLEPVQQLDE